MVITIKRFKKLYGEKNYTNMLIYMQLPVCNTHALPGATIKFNL